MKERDVLAGVQERDILTRYFGGCAECVCADMEINPGLFSPLLGLM